MEYERKPIKVKYKGEEFWFQQEKDGSGPVSPLNHCFDDGELNIETMFSSDSFAHVNTKRVMERYGKELGKIEEFIKPTP